MNAWPWLSLLARIVVAIAATSAVTSAALADDAVTTLGVRSLDGEDQLERRVSQVLRVTARAISGYDVSDREVSLAQMSLAHGCEEVDSACLTEIASTLSAERLLYGNMVRSGDKVRITLFNFDAQRGQVSATAERTFGPAHLTEPTFTELMTQLVQKLSGMRGSATGTLRITGNRPGATVSIDGTEVGVLDDEGELILPKVSEGSHSVLVETSDGRDRRELSVDVRPETTTTLRALLTPALPQVSDDEQLSTQPEPSESRAPTRDRRQLRRKLGWVFIGLTGAFAVATVGTWIGIKKVGESETLDVYRSFWPKPSEPGGTDDACREAKDSNLARRRPNEPLILELESQARDKCTRGSRLEKAQYALIGGTVATAITGAILLLTSRPQEPSATVQLRPRIGFASASLEASYRF